jgi:hypothetical protein
MKRIVIASLLFCLAGCSSDKSEGIGGASGAGAAGGTGGSGGSGGSTGGSGGTSGGSDAGTDIVVGPCTEPGSVCQTLKFPAVTDAPTRMICGFYTMELPPVGPPDKTGVLMDMPKVAAGSEVQLKMLAVGLDGDFFLYCALYMPGGGQFQTKKGIDYETFTTSKVTLSKGGPTTLSGTLEFALAK